MGFWGYHGAVSLCLYILDIALAITFFLRVTEYIPPASWKYLEILLAGIALTANVAYWMFLGCCGKLYISPDTEMENELRSQHHSKSTLAYTFAVIIEMVFLIGAAKVDPIDPNTIVSGIVYNPAMMTSYTTQKAAALACSVFAVMSLWTISDYYYYRDKDSDFQNEKSDNESLIAKTGQWAKTKIGKSFGAGAPKSREQVLARMNGDL